MVAAGPPVSGAGAHGYSPSTIPVATSMPFTGDGGMAGIG